MRLCRLAKSRLRAALCVLLLLACLPLCSGATDSLSHRHQLQEGLANGARDIQSLAASGARPRPTSTGTFQAARSRRRRPRIRRASFLFQNVRGLKTDDAKDLFFHNLLRRNGAIAAGLAETWGGLDTPDYDHRP